MFPSAKLSKLKQYRMALSHLFSPNNDIVVTLSKKISVRDDTDIIRKKNPHQADPNGDSVFETKSCLLMSEALCLLADELGIVEIVDAHRLSDFVHRLSTHLARLLRTFL